MLAKEENDKGSSGEVTLLMDPNSSSSGDTNGTVGAGESTRDSSTDPFTDNFEQPRGEDEIRPLFEEGDQSVQSYNIGLELVDVLNVQRQMF